MSKVTNNKLLSGHPRPRGARSVFSPSKDLADPNLKYGTVPGFDGTPIFYCSEGKGPPLVFCYGFACSMLHWTYQVDYFKQNYQCIWIDYRGHGLSPMPDKPESMNIESIVKDVDTVLQHLGIEKAIFLGHSMGVSVVLDYALQFPEKVERLVLANGTPKRPLETLFGGNFLSPAFQLFLNVEKNMPEVVEEAWNMKGKAEVFSFLFGALGFNRQLAHEDDIRAYAEQIASFPPLVMALMMADYEKFDATPWLHQIKQPTLVISGDKDYITPPETQDLIHQLIPHSEMLRVRGGSHCCTMDLPELVNLSIEKFIKS